MVPLQQGAIGVIIQRTAKEYQTGTVIDLSSTSTRTFVLTKPSGKVITKSGSLVSGGTDGLVKWTTQAGDLDEAGDWSQQLEYVNSNGTYLSEIETLEVRSNLR